MGEEVIGVGSLLTDLLLTLRILNFCLLSQVFLVALTGLVTIIFFPLLVYCSETLVLFERFLRFLQDVITDFLTFSFFNDVALPVLLSLNFDHVIVFGAVALFLSFQILLTLHSLLV